MGVLLLVAVVAGLVWLVATYNGLVNLKNQVVNALKQIDVQLKRRHDLVPNLVETVRGAMAHERQTLEAVIAARSQAMRVMATGSVGQMAAAEAQLSGALGRLMGVVEAYPDLKGMATIGQLQEELTSTENKIAFARQLYNDTATQYNTRQEQFPANFIAAIAGATPVELWEISDAAERAVPRVDLGAAPSVTLAPKPSA
jgi:LemA protein